jgi:chemotaxis protein CheC
LEIEVKADHDSALSIEEKEILQEVMNIAFGKASANLADVIDIYVALSVPNILIMPASKVKNYIENEVKDYGIIDMVKQQYWGEFKGIAFLIFPSGAGKKLVSLFQKSENLSFDSEPIDAMEKETLLEVGNILIGACVGKLAELLGDIVTYSPPAAMIEQKSANSISKNTFGLNCTAIILKTVFRFENEDVSGNLFLTTSNESIHWLKEALNKILDEYE